MATRLFKNVGRIVNLFALKNKRFPSAVLLWSLAVAPLWAGYVQDNAAVLAQGEIAHLEALLTDLDQKTSAQIAVVTVSSLEGRDVNSVAVDLFKKMGIGQREKNNGVLFLLAPQERKIRIEVGYGLEALLPDGKVGRLLDESVVPYFKAGQLSAGVVSGVERLAEIIAQDAGVTLSVAPSRAPPVSETKRSRLSTILFFIIVLFVLLNNPLLGGLLLSHRGGRSRGGWGSGSSGGFGGGGFGGFGGGSSGGGGASRGW